MKIGAQNLSNHGEDAPATSNYQLPTTKSPLVVIVGETGTGKSTLAMQLAERFNGEIICADALTVRRHANIGTAKPSAEDRARVAHHLLDVVEPCADFTAAVFKRLAVKAIAEITARGKLPFLVGGTGLYIDGVIFDYGFLPAGDRQQREALNALSAPQLVEKARTASLNLDSIDTGNKRRLIRLLENNGQLPTKSGLRSDTIILGLKVERTELDQRIESRADSMLAGGLEQEVRQLSERYGWSCEALKSIGYREWQPYFAGTQSLEETRAKIIKSTLDLAKKQRTWFKRNDSIQWVDKQSEAVEITTTFLNNLSA